LVAEKFEKCPK